MPREPNDPARRIAIQPGLVEQVYEAILSEITEGGLLPNARLIQGNLAAAYGVSRQPVQQALLLLRDHGLVRDAPGRGLVVSPVDVGFVRNLYAVRAVLEGLAARMADQLAKRDASPSGSPGGPASVTSVRTMPSGSAVER